jgi:hypothetical protein
MVLSGNPAFTDENLDPRSFDRLRTFGDDKATGRE